MKITIYGWRISLNPPISPMEPLVSLVRGPFLPLTPFTF
jgi:hypothetical protein